MKRPFFPFYPDDFISGTVALTNEEVGIYIRLLCLQWNAEKIPIDRVGMIVGRPWSDFSPYLRSKFVEDGEYIQNERLTATSEKQNILINAKSKAGKKSASLRNSTKKQQKSNRTPNTIPTEGSTQLQHNTQQNPNNQLGLVLDMVMGLNLDLVLPFKSEEFLKMWAIWKIYKKQEHGFKYKSFVSEQAALNKLADLEPTEQRAILTIKQSIENGWKGFFKLKTDETKTDITTEINDAINFIFAGKE
jgi:uncharacterized protein YdaU (DUF1376 family)